MLRGCLHSILAQEAIAFEVIVVDDASIDGTAAVMAEFTDNRVRVARHSHPRGGAASRNAGIAMAKGTWVAFCDDDDLWAPSKLRKQVTAGNSVGAGLVYCGAVTFSDSCEGVSAGGDVPSPAFVRDNILRGNPLPGGSSAQMVRRDVLDAVGGFDADLPILGDWDLWIRILAVATAAGVAEALVAYRQHAGNKVLTHLDAHIAEFDRIVAKHGAAARQRGIRMDGAGFYYWLASGQRRAGSHWGATRVHLEAALRYRSVRHFGSALRSPFGARAVGIRSRARLQREPDPDWLRQLRTPIAVSSEETPATDSVAGSG
jgi:glycosyltransferase involved in cell wall biosynthesis